MISRAAMMLFVVLCSLTAWAQDFTQNNVNYYIADDGETAYVGTSSEATGDMTILDKITVGSKQYPVTIIGTNAFSSTSLTSVIIPNSVLRIEQGAFYDCQQLLTVTIGSGVTYIGFDAFYASTNVKDVYMYADPEALDWSNEGGCDDFNYNGTTICHVADASLWYAKFAGIVNLKFIDPNTTPFSFTYDEATHTLTVSGSEPMPYSPNWGVIQYEIEHVVIEDGVLAIGGYAFYYCTQLKSISIPSSVITIGEYAFFNYCELTSISLPSSVRFIGANAFQSCSSLTSIDLPPVTEIKRYTFSYCSSLVSVNIPNTVTLIEYDAFGYCEKLTSIDIPASVTNIAGGNLYNVFPNCTSLTSINVAEDNPYYSSIDGVVYTKDGRDLLCCPAGKSSIEFPENVEKIGIYAFQGCPFTSLTIPEGIYRIYSYAFENCKNLKWVNLPASLYEFSGSAFSGNMPSLTAINVAEDNPNYKSIAGVVYSKDGSKLVRCPNGFSSMDIPSFVTTIDKNSFSYCNALTSITIPNNVTTIGGAAFNVCERLKTVTIGSGVTVIEGDAFYYSRKITDVYCYANPETLEWTDAGYDEFMDDKATICHVFDAEAFKAKWDTGDTNNDVRVTFQADLLPQVEAAELAGVNLTTYYNSTSNVKVDAGTQVFKVAMNGSQLSVTEVEDRIIKAGEGVILKSQYGIIGMATTTEESSADYSDNILEGVDVDTSKPVGYMYYSLAESNGDLAFSEISGNLLLAHKAYLKSTFGPSAYYFDDATSIQTIDNGRQSTEEAIYNLSGQRLSKPAKGINIVGGKKIAVK